MKPILLCILLGINPAHIANIPYVFKSQSIEFVRGHIFACVEEKVGGEEWASGMHIDSTFWDSKGMPLIAKTVFLECNMLGRPAFSIFVN